MTTTNIKRDTDFQRWLISKHACSEAREWASDRTAECAWEECQQGDWLLWWAAMAGVDRKALVLASCACARLALPHVTAGELRPLKAIEIAERWAHGEATIEEVRSAASAARSEEHTSELQSPLNLV